MIFMMICILSMLASTASTRCVSDFKRSKSAPVTRSNASCLESTVGASRQKNTLTSFFSAPISPKELSIDTLGRRDPLLPEIPLPLKSFKPIYKQKISPRNTIPTFPRKEYTLTAEELRLVMKHQARLILEPIRTINPVTSAVQYCWVCVGILLADGIMRRSKPQN